MCVRSTSSCRTAPLAAPAVPFQAISSLLPTGRNKLSDPMERARSDARNLSKIVNRMERPVVSPILDDGISANLADSWERLQLVNGGRVDVQQRGRWGSSAGI